MADTALESIDNITQTAENIDIADAETENETQVSDLSEEANEKSGETESSAEPVTEDSVAENIAENKLAASDVSGEAAAETIEKSDAADPEENKNDAAENMLILDNNAVTAKAPRRPAVHRQSKSENTNDDELGIVQPELGF